MHTLFKPKELNLMSQQAQIEETIAHYAQGWYQGDVARMKKALHPALAKRAWLTAQDGSKSLSEFPCEKLLERVAKITADTYTDANKRMDIRILASTDNIASAILDMDQWTDHMHLVCINGTWSIMNILWEPRS
jgi:hypothetical protein